MYRFSLPVEKQASIKILFIFQKKTFFASVLPHVCVTLLAQLNRNLWIMQIIWQIIRAQGFSFFKVIHTSSLLGGFVAVGQAIK